ncbi:MAG: DUF3858 domain-containing protein [Reichenbachiella sp.]|uniref:DUF3858 domain-containing protein n=1 Tax=Reichenbachiella sp. TaxID=2184521 RepID=UPI003266BE7E
MMKRLFAAIVLYISIVVSGLSQDATINNHEISYKINSNYKIHSEEFYSITVHNKDGYDLAVYQDYYDKFKKVTAIEILVFNNQGKKIKKFNKNDVLDIALNQSYEIDDSRLLIKDPEYGVYPFRVEVRVSSTQKGFIGLPTWIPRSTFNLEVIKSSLVVEAPADFVIKSLVENEVEFKKEQILLENNQFLKYTWSVRDLPAIDNDMVYKEFINKQPKVRLTPEKFAYDKNEGSFLSWSTFGDWFLDLNRGRDSLTVETIRFLDQLEKTDTRNVIGQVYQYMQDRTRYISIQLGIGGFQSIPSHIVDQKGYGDCKALTNYMKSMLEYLDINSNYILVKAGRDVPDVIEDFPSNQFNHLFLGVPMTEDTIFLECTSQTQPFDYVGSFTDDRNVLWIENGSSQIIRSPIYGEDFNRQQTVSKVTIDKNGNSEMQNSIEQSGFFYESFQRISQLSATQLEQYNYSVFPYKDFSIDNYEVIEPKNSDPVYTAQYNLSVKNLARNASSKLLIPINVLQPVDSYLEVNKYAKFAEIRRSFLVEDEVELSLPDGAYTQMTPENVEISGDYGSYSVTLTKNETSILIKRRIKIYKGRYEDEDFAAFYNFFKRIKSNDTKKIVVESKT